MTIDKRNPTRVVAGLVLVLAGGVLVGLFVSKALDGAGVSASAEPSASTASSPESTSPSAPGSAEATLPPAPGWTMSPFPEAEEGDQLERIADLGELIFVVGNHGPNGGIWHSPDGVTWQLASDRPTSRFELGAQIHGIARGDAGYVAVGANYVVDGAFPLIWFSPDGDHWTDVTPDAEECIPLASVTAAGTRFVAVGSRCRYDEQAVPQQDGLSFVSTDGVHWDRSPVSDELVDIGLGDVISTELGFVATGGHFGAWAGTLESADGLTWTRSPGGGTPDARYVRRLMSADGRFLAVGEFIDAEGEQRAAVWSSSDLQEWEHRVVGAAGTQAIAMAFDGGEWVLIGGVIGTDYSWSSSVEWRSGDGVKWGEPAAVISDASGYLSDMISGPGGLLAIGGLLTETAASRSSLPLLLQYAR
jgi:hypothetical protein